MKESITNITTNETSEETNSFLETDLVRRIIIFFSTLFTISFSMAVDFSHGKDFSSWIAYWTHISCLMVLGWSFTALIGEVVKNEKLTSIVESLYWKGLTTIVIIVTGTVFFVFGLIPVLYYGIKNNEPEIIFSTFFLHIVTPSLMFWEFSSKWKLTGNDEKETNKQKISILFIFPAMYFVFVMLLISNGANPPYPIFNFSSAPDIFSNNEYLEYFWYVASIVSSICVALWFVFISKICLNWEKRINKKEIKKLNKKEESSK